jgi:hypothetical protein
VRAADVGLTFITVATGLLLESGDVHASRSTELALATPDDASSSPLLHSARGSQLDPSMADGPTVVVADRLAPRRSTAAELCHDERSVPGSRTARRAHRPRGPPVS